MPKGALLHAHLDATVNATFLLKLALQQPALHIRAPNVISASTINSTLPEFRALSADQFSANDSPGVTESSYSPLSWVSLQQARQSFDAELGGPEGFDKWVLDAMMIRPEEAYGTHNTVAKVCLHF